MDDFLTKALRDEVWKAQASRVARKSRLRVEVAGESFPVLSVTPSGFSVAVDDAPHLRGLVDLYDGARHISQCLIIAASEEAGQMVYEFKRNTPAGDGAPLDFVRAADTPVAYLSRYQNRQKAP